MYLLQSFPVDLGVTSCNPDKMSRLREYPRGFSPSCLMYAGDLWKNDDYVGPCPRLYVSPGDDVSIRHTHKQIHFYKNKHLHYTCDIEIPAPVWGWFGLFDINKISIEGEEFLIFYFENSIYIYIIFLKAVALYFCNCT